MLLDHLRVIDIGSFVAAPAAATAMSDFGADVIKVEPLDGDAYRRLLAGYPSDYFWLLTSRNKRSLALDVKSDSGLAVFHRLVASADVLITNYRADLVLKLGIDYASVREIREDIIYAHVAGYGHEGQESQRPAFDTTAWWGRSGMQEFTRDVGAPPIISAPGQGDHATAMSVFGAVMAALYRRERTGAGAYVSTSLLANGVWSNGTVLQALFEGTDWSSAKHTGESTRAPLLTLYQTADDRWVQLSLLNPAKEWAPFTEAVYRPDWLTDPRFATVEARTENARDLQDAIAQAIRALSLETFRTRMDARKITYGYAAHNRDLSDDPQLVDNEMVVPTQNSEGDYHRTIMSPIRIADEQKRTPSRAPSIGEHTDEVLGELGFSLQDVAELRSAGVVV